MTATPGRSKDTWMVAARAALLLGFAVVLWRTAWIGDDAFITFRTVENVAQGYGLRWNTADRVQTSTHPLWMLVAIGLRFATGELYFTTLAWSALLSVSACGVVAFLASADARGGICAVVALSTSRAFVDYSTSGLENPLTHLLLALIVVGVLRSEERPLRSLAVCGGLLLFNRLDMLILVGPVLTLVFGREILSSHRWSALRALAVGFAPLVGWFAFASFYFGSPLPVTAAAKAFGTGIPASEMAWQSVWYYKWLIVHDPITPALIVSGCAVALWRAPRRAEVWALVGGVSLYGAYIVKIGGDFMGGRFFAAPVLVAVACVAAVWRPLPWRAAAVIMAAVLMIGVAGGAPTWLSGPDYGNPHIDDHGIDDERAFYFERYGLTSEGRAVPVYGSAAKAIHDATPDSKLYMVAGAAGIGYEQGANVHLIDKWLTDPLLARLPAGDPGLWRIGHIERRIPEGYLESVVSGENRIRHPGLARYYGTLRQVTEGDLFSTQRFEALWRHWTGADTDGFRAFLDEEYRSPPPLLLSAETASANSVAAGTKWFEALDSVHILYDGGVHISFGQDVRHTQFAVGLHSPAIYGFHFFAGDRELARVPLQSMAALWMQQHILDVPAAVVERGYDRIEVYRYFADIAAFGYLRSVE